MRQGGLYGGAYMIDALGKTLAQLVSRPFRHILWRALALTVLLIVALAALGVWAIGLIPNFGVVWADAAIDLVAGAAVAVALIFLVVPVTALCIPLFQEDVARAVEAAYYPHRMGQREQSPWEGLRLGVTALAVVVAVNLLALPLVVVLPGLGFAVFLAVNGFVLGREFFEAAAIRHYPPAHVTRLRRQNAGTIFVAGLAVAALLAIPLLNILVPLFGMALMVHVLHRVIGMPDIP